MKQSSKKPLKVVVTGAASGIGLELCKQYLAKGFSVAGLDIQSPKIDHENFHPFHLDVSQGASFDAFSRKYQETIGKPDIWINNAGISHVAPFEETPPEVFEKVMEVNLNGVIYGTRTALCLMKNPERGCIANVSSVAGEVASPYLSAYSGSKHAVVGFTRALQEEKRQAHSPLKIILVIPGFVETQIMEKHSGYEFPQWLNWMRLTPQATAKQVIQGIEKGHLEIRPSLHGRLISTSHRIFPGRTLRASKLLVAKDLKELFGVVPIQRSNKGSGQRPKKN
jgi:short-subunit dehydrogenase